MKAVPGTTAKLTDNDWLVVRYLPLHLRCIVHISVPADVLVEAYHIHKLIHIVVQSVHVVRSTRNFHCHRNQTGIVQRAGILSQVAQECIALGGMRRLVSDTPYDDVGTVMVTCNHICQLILGVLVGLGILPGNGPVNRNLGPYQNTHLLCLAHHLLVVGVVCQTYKVTSQFLGPREQGTSILNAVGPTASVGLLIVYTNAFQEDRLSVQKYLLITCLDGAETYFIADSISAHAYLYLIELGILG